jgi:hypothetical protein
VAVNRVLRPLRVPDPDQLHTCMDDHIGFTKSSTLAWYARFDDAGDSDAAPVAAASVPGRTVLYGSPGQTVPRSGKWVIENFVGYEVWLEAGETFPPGRVSNTEPAQYRQDARYRMTISSENAG